MENTSSNGGKAETSVHFSATGDTEAVNVEIHSPGGNRAKTKKRRLPILFERAGSWWPTPRFDSAILEKEQWKSYFPQTRRRFQLALFYTLAACVVWAIFFAASQQEHWPHFLAGSLVLLTLTSVTLGFTYTKYYLKLHLAVAVFASCLICVGILLPYAFDTRDISTIGTFTATVEVLLMMYTLIPMPLLFGVLIGVTYSILYEVFTATRNDMQQPHFIAGKLLLHLCIHLMGIHIFIMRQVRQRSTFWKIGQSVIARRDLQIEQQIKEKMIHSLMPPSVAAEVMRARDDKNTDENADDQRTKKRSSRAKAHAKGEIIFRPFNMNTMENVSILFADIVGFTKMSSNKTAEHLVGLLNDLFGRFDDLCVKSGCEKISTLGDCYYCVSGCPEPRPDHAKCCVEMGLGMITAIMEFDEENNEQVNMRVGVHTGTVLCGIVGTRRFKFDVWSNDVTLANTMESSGLPGKVHISDASYDFLKDDYEVEEGPLIQDNRTAKVLIEHYDTETSQYAVKHEEDERNIKTYFIKGPKEKDTGAGATAEVEKTEEVKPESVTVAMDTDTSAPPAHESDNLIKDHSAADKEESEAPEEGSGLQLTNHCGSKSADANGVSPAQLLGRRHSSGFYATSEMSLDQIMDKGSLKTQRNNAACTKPSASRAQKQPGTKVNHNSTAVVLDSHPKTNPTSSGTGITPLKNGVTKGLSTDQKPHKEEQFDPSSEPMNETWKKVQNIHHQTDKHIVQCVREGVKNKEYFYKPPINMCTLAFLDSELESDYRDHYLDEKHEQKTISAPKYHAFLEIFVAFLVFIFISIFCFIIFDRRLPWLIVFCIALVLEVTNLIRVIAPIKCSKKSGNNFWNKVNHFTSGWYFRNVLGAVVASVPLAAVFSNFSCDLMTQSPYSDRFFCYCLVVSFLHYTNFTTLSSWLKTILAVIAGVILIVLLLTVACTSVDLVVESTTVLSIVTPVGVSNVTDYNITSGSSTSVPPLAQKTAESLFSGGNLQVVQIEIIVDMLLLLFLIGFLNRESEISYRLNYHGDEQSWKYQQEMQENKDQADWLLHNIIPKHVSDVVRKTSKYSKNHKDVGVIFAAIVNFNEIYDESFEGGREFLRVLNELVSDYEELLDDPRFKDVEKIKTISSTFMAASGLNEQTRSQNNHPHAHLYALMEFSVGLQNAIQRFNDSIFNFDFILNIGYNYGEVTAGVIGTTKLLFDIWGDTVNIASRMYSTGVNSRIQVPEATAKLLGDKMDFEYRAQISVKGKGEMRTYLFQGVKPGASWE